MTGVSYLVHYDTLLQNETDIVTECHNYFITKCDFKSSSTKKLFHIYKRKDRDDLINLIKYR